MPPGPADSQFPTYLPHFQSTTSSQMGRNYPTEMQAAVHRPVDMHLRASSTYLSLGFF